MTLLVFERFSRVTPLGVRFWDVAAQAPIVDGLMVTARTTQNRSLPMFANSKGVYVLQNVPGLRAFETGDGSDAFWNNAPSPQTYRLTVRDIQGRFHPFTFEADLPTRGIFVWDCPLSPPLTLVSVPSGYVPAYPTTNRFLPGGMVAVRADLYDPDARVPAAWATLAVLLDGAVLGHGIADARGCVSVMFPCPELVDTTPGSSPLDFGMPLEQQSWQLSLRATYRPLDPVPSMPDLCAILSQPEAELWRVWNSPADREPCAGVDLLYGREAIATSFDSADEPLSRLYITPV